MEAPAKGAVVLIRFPFSDLSRTKLRPAVALAEAGGGDGVLCQVTSKPYGDSAAVVLDDTGLRVRFLARDQLRSTGKTVHGEQRSDDWTSRVAHNRSANADRGPVVSLMRAEI